MSASDAFVKGCARQLVGDKVDENDNQDNQQRDGAAVLRVAVSLKEKSIVVSR